MLSVISQKCSLVISARTLSDHVGLDISVVILASPNEGSVGLERLSDHVVDQPVLVPDSQFVEVALVLSVGKQTQYG